MTAVTLQVFWLLLCSGYSCGALKSGVLPFQISLQDLGEQSSDRCYNDTQLYLHDLSKLKLWAVQMYDASAKLPSGILWGNAYSLGNYDECLKVDQGLVKGRYCLARISLKPANISNWPQERAPRIPDLQYFGPEDSVLNFIERSIVDPSKSRRDVLFWGVCVPFTCESGHVERHVSRQLTEWAADLGLETDVEVTSCQDPTILSLSTPTIIYLSVIGLLILLVLVTTSIDIIYYIRNNQIDLNNGGKFQQCLFCFSMYRNVKRLVSSNQLEGDDLRCIHGIKFITIIIIVFGHRITYSMSSPAINFIFIEKMQEHIETVMVQSGAILVDTFFIISGFLLCYSLMSAYHRGTKVPLHILYVNRYIRLTPALGVIVGFHALVLPQLGDGPLWHQKVGYHVDRCVHYWWATLLYVNNYVHPGDICVNVSWYLSADIQLFLISCPLIWLLWKRPRCGKIVLGVVTALTIVIPVVITAALHLEPLLVFMDQTEDTNKAVLMRIAYLPTHFRATPYFAGILCGYLKFQHKQNKFKPSRLVRGLCWLILCPISVLVMMMAWFFYVPGSRNSVLVNLLYAGVQRVGWALGIGWAILDISITKSNGWVLLFGTRPMLALGRLTYCVYLVHNTIQLYSTATLRAPITLSSFQVIWVIIADISLSIIIGGLLSLIVESPILALEKLLLKKQLQKSSPASEKEPPENRDRFCLARPKLLTPKQHL